MARIFIYKSSAGEVVDILKNSDLSERGVTAGSGRDCLRKGEYFGNVA